MIQSAALIITVDVQSFTTFPQLSYTDQSNMRGIFSVT